MEFFFLVGTLLLSTGVGVQDRSGQWNIPFSSSAIPWTLTYIPSFLFMVFTVWCFSITIYYSHSPIHSFKKHFSRMVWSGWHMGTHIPWDFVHFLLFSLRIPSYRAQEWSQNNAASWWPQPKCNCDLPEGHRLSVFWKIPSWVIHGT